MSFEYRRVDNCFTALDKPTACSALMSSQLETAWPAALDACLRSANSTRPLSMKETGDEASCGDSAWARGSNGPVYLIK